MTNMEKKKLKKTKVETFLDVYTSKKTPIDRQQPGPDGLFDVKRKVENCELFYNTPLSMDSPHNTTDILSGKTIDKRDAYRTIVQITKSKVDFALISRATKLINVRLKKRPDMDSGTYSVPKIVFDSLKTKESLFDGIFYEYGSGFRPSPEPVRYESFEYPIVVKNMMNGLGTNAEKLKYGMISPTHHISEGKRYSYGVEIETSGGRLMEPTKSDLSLKCVYDGSIRDNQGNKGFGGEYVTGVLAGDNGFKHLYHIVDELRKRCAINNTCSIHVHLGGIQFSKETVVMIWKLGQMLEAELFTMMPKSRITRPHCAKIKPLKLDFKEDMPYKMIIDKYYNTMFEIVSLGHTPSKTVNKKFNHPAGHSCGYDTSTPRYWWLNFVPVMFNLKGEKNYTIEYRMHSATLNYTKIKNWILICMGMLYVSSNHQRVLMNNNKITLNEVMDLAYSSKAQYLKDYIAERKAKFSPSTENENMAEKYEYVIDRSEVKKDIVKISDAVWE